MRQLTINARSSLSALCALLLVACADPDAPTAVLPTTPPGAPVNFDAFAALADPLAPARWLPGRSFLASSRAPDPVDGFDNVDAALYVGVRVSVPPLVEFFDDLAELVL